VLIWIAAGTAVFLFLRHNEIGRQAPDFALQGAYGGEYRLDSFRGRPVLLVFWNTNCGICRHELPILDRLLAWPKRIVFGRAGARPE
jgi:thiol-disulfide isomerase/thioredoxin